MLLISAVVLLASVQLALSHLQSYIYRVSLLFVPLKHENATSVVAVPFSADSRTAAGGGAVSPLSPLAWTEVS